jgi:UDP-N-acetylglucosamine 2-epimerase
MVIAGTRPEAIKLAPVLLALKHTPVLQSVLGTTGQHHEMLRQAWEAFGLTPDINMDVMTSSQTLPGLSARLSGSVNAELEAHKPDFLLLQGDTTTVMVAATCAYYRNIPVGHVAAGLRSHDLGKPFPEEFNRRVAGLATMLAFDQTAGAAQNLYAEMVSRKCRVFITENYVDLDNSFYA